MTLDLLPKALRQAYECYEWKHACAILRTDFPCEWNDLIQVLSTFQLRKSWIVESGGRKSKVAEAFDSQFYARGWVEKDFSTRVQVDEQISETPTHGVDCFKNKIAIEIEWNNKDSFYDRDLNNFRLLFDLRAVSVGIIITRCDELQDIFKNLGRASKAILFSFKSAEWLYPLIGRGCSLTSVEPTDLESAIALAHPLPICQNCCRGLKAAVQEDVLCLFLAFQDHFIARIYEHFSAK